MSIKETTILDIIVYMIKNNTNNIAINLKGMKMGLNIELVKRESEEK